MKDVVIKLFAVATMLFAYIVTHRTPMMWEDVVYTLKADAALGAAMSNSAVADTIQLGRYERVRDMSDLAESTYYHYMNANGRLFPHLTSQSFGTLIGKPVFDILNAAMLVLLVTLVTLLIAGNGSNYWRWWVVTLSALWLLMPETNTCFFLMTYALNYLWSSVLCTAFLWFYLRQGKKPMAAGLMLVATIFAFGAGWSHEGLSVGIAGALLLDNIIDWTDRRLNGQKLTLAIAFCTGAALLCLSPGNFTRTDAALPLYNHLLSFARLRLFWLFLLAWVVLSRSIDFVIRNRVLLMALSVQAAFMFYAGYRNGRVLWGTELLSLILLLKVFADMKSTGRVLKVVSYSLLTALVLHFSWLVYRSGEIRRQYDEVIALYKASPDGSVSYDLDTESALVKRFIPAPLCDGRDFELRTFSLYYTRELKMLKITPTKE